MSTPPEPAIVDDQQDGGKRKRKRRRAWKPYSQLDWEEKKKIEEEEDKKAVKKELTKPKVQVPKRMKRGMNIHDFRPETPRITTSAWMNVHENDVDVNDPTNLPPNPHSGEAEVLESLDDQFGTMESLLKQENQKQIIDRLTKENRHLSLKARISKLEKEIVVLKGNN